MKKFSVLRFSFLNHLWHRNRATSWEPLDIVNAHTFLREGDYVLGVQVNDRRDYIAATCGMDSKCPAGLRKTFFVEEVTDSVLMRDISSSSNIGVYFKYLPKPEGNRVTIPAQFMQDRLGIEFFKRREVKERLMEIERSIGGKYEFNWALFRIKFII